MRIDTLGHVQVDPVQKPRQLRLGIRYHPMPVVRDHTKRMDLDAIRLCGVRHTVTDDLIDLITRQQPELSLGATPRDQICSPRQDRSWSHIYSYRCELASVACAFGWLTTSQPYTRARMYSSPTRPTAGQTCPNTGHVRLARRLPKHRPSRPGSARHRERVDCTRLHSTQLSIHKTGHK